MKKLLYRFHNFKYRYKLMILILIAGIIPTMIVTCYMQVGMMKTLKEREINNMQESLKQAVDAMEDQAQIYENLIDYLSYSADLRQVLKMKGTSDFQTYQNYTQVADPLLNMPQVYHKEIEEITLYADNIQVAHGSTMAPLSEIQDESWYPRNNSSLIHWYVQTGSQKKVIAARKFYDGSSEIHAVLKITLDYEELFEPFEKIMESNFAGIVLDEDGDVVYSCNKIPEKYGVRNLDTLSGIPEEFSGVDREMEGNQWRFCYFCPTEIIMESAKHLMLKNLPILSACLLLIGILSYFFSRRLVRKLEQLTENMNQIHSGIREVTVQSDSKDEIGVLIRTFRRMMKEINKLISEVYEAKIVLQRTEMRALQAQINPHFLYNSLSIINWKAIEADEPEISKVTLALSTYYRTSLNRGETMTTVASEMENIRAYLKIQLIMHDNSFQVEEVYDEAVAHCKIPKLILQPLVENAIDHGLDVSEKEEKRLQITVKQEEDFLYFIVKDNGNGMSQEKAQQIITYQSKGYGVRNVNERIVLLYGEENRIQIESREGEGTRVRIRIPRKKECGYEKTESTY